MAEIVAGIGSSHGPQLKMDPDAWDERGRFDRTNRNLVFQGRDHTFEELAAQRADFSEQCTPRARRAHYDASRAALRKLGEVVRASRPDVLVIVSSDHKEIYGDELLPPFTVYWGDTVDHVPFTREHLDAMAPGLSMAAAGDVPSRPTVRACHPDLARRLIDGAAADGFDVAASKRLPPGRYGNHGIPHGWGFVYQQILGEDCTIPMVPVFVNTFYEPNPPDAARCLAFGRSLGRTIAAAPDDLRVAVVASGGLSHFVIDEELDRSFLAALRDRDTGRLATLDAAVLRSGTSELRNWITVAGALEHTGLRAQVVDYQPCYRTEAGTGNAMGFAAWTPDR